MKKASRHTGHTFVYLCIAYHTFQMIQVRLVHITRDALPRKKTEHSKFSIDRFSPCTLATRSSRDKNMIDRAPVYCDIGKSPDVLFSSVHPLFVIPQEPNFQVASTLRFGLVRFASTAASTRPGGSIVITDLAVHRQPLM